MFTSKEGVAVYLVFATKPHELSSCSVTISQNIAVIVCYYEYLIIFHWGCEVVSKWIRQNRVSPNGKKTKSKLCKLYMEKTWPLFEKVQVFIVMTTFMLSE